ncbi:hypothetical protein A9Q75_14350 [Colwellia psychrerythraea]|uniref:HPt domain-containing protein n=1 Tax=Colwellia psychrerythraea TaxID=28229 RepID=A0A1Y5EBZ2_COLPS|nr:hypothetical protein A9Q75_14350 [Colwellia psychrerythraea]
MDYSPEVKLFMNVFQGDLDSAKEVAIVFCQYIPKLLVLAKNAYQKNDVVGLKDCLHKLKGSIGYAGFIIEAKKIELLEKKLNTTTSTLEINDFNNIIRQNFLLVEMINLEILSIRNTI